MMGEREGEERNTSCRVLLCVLIIYLILFSVKHLLLRFLFISLNISISEHLDKIIYYPGKNTMNLSKYIAALFYPLLISSKSFLCLVNAHNKPMFL